MFVSDDLIPLRNPGYTSVGYMRYTIWALSTYFSDSSFAATLNFHTTWTFLAILTELQLEFSKAELIDDNLGGADNS